jgi:hypothetical protein
MRGLFLCQLHERKPHGDEERKAPPFDKLRAGFLAKDARNEATREKWGTRYPTVTECVISLEQGDGVNGHGPSGQSLFMYT